MRLIVIEDGGMIADVVCEREPLYIGSHPDCRVRLADSRIAPQQAVIYPEAEHEWALQQLDTSHELHVNGATITGRTTLKTGDEIQICDFLIRVFPDYHDVSRSKAAIGTSQAQLHRFAQFHQLPSGSTVKKLDEPITVLPGQLDRIGQLTLRLAQCTAVEDLMNVTIGALQQAFAPQRVWLGVRRVNYGAMEYVEGRLNTGQATDLPEVGERLRARALDRAQYVLIPTYSPDERLSILAGPLVGPDGILGMVYLEHDADGRRFDSTDLDLLMITLHAVSVQLDVIFKQLARQRTMTVEGVVAVAHAIQARLTPRRLPQWDRLQFGAFREPGREKAGDFYDVVKLASKHAAVLVAHTPAVGALPSMLMGQAHTAFRLALMHHDSPSMLLRSLNYILHDGHADRLLDCFAATIDPESGEVKYAVGGQIGAYIIGGRGEERTLCGAPAPPLGQDRASVYPLFQETLEEGENLVLFTPGVTSARNRAGEGFGQERFINILCDGFGQLASNMLKEMYNDLRSFTEGGSQPEDITVLLAHRAGL